MFILAQLLPIFTSCSDSNYPRVINTNFPHTNPNEILIYSKDANQDYAIIGAIGTKIVGDEEADIEHLKKKASKQGADAIIHVKLTQVNPSTKQIGVSGIAVKLNKNINVDYSLAKK